MELYFVYILRSFKNGKLYIGYTSDVENRVRRHNQGVERYTKSGLPWELIHKESFSDKSSAIKREKALKKLKNPGYILERIVNDNSGGGAAR